MKKPSAFHPEEILDGSPYIGEYYQPDIRVYKKHEMDKYIAWLEEKIKVKLQNERKSMRGKKLVFKTWGSQFLYELAQSAGEVYQNSGMKDFGKLKVETFINEVSKEVERRGDWPPEEC